MEGLGIEVRTIRPLYGSESCVEFHAVEHLQILKCPKHLTFEHGSEINPLLASVSEAEGQRVGPDDLKTSTRWIA